MTIKPPGFSVATNRSRIGRRSARCSRTRREWTKSNSACGSSSSRMSTRRISIESEASWSTKRVDVDRGDVRTAPGHPFDERATARADLEAFPAGADAEFLEQCAAAAIPQRLHAGKPCPLLGEALVEDIVAGHD